MFSFWTVSEQSSLVPVLGDDTDRVAETMCLDYQENPSHWTAGGESGVLSLEAVIRVGTAGSSAVGR